MLERAYQKKDRFLIFVGIARELDGYRADPRYASIIERVGLAGRVMRN